MPPSQRPVTHLPLLYNPFLNCLFNNPHYDKPPFKQTIEELRNHNDFTILVPPAHILHSCYDPATESSSTKVLLRELCYNNEDFIRSHIIRTGTSYSSTITPISKVQSVIYNTMNGKQVLFKNGMVFMGKGFKKSLKLNILSFQYFTSFCDYFPKGSKFMILYVEDSLIGSFNPVKRSRILPHPEIVPGPKVKETKDDIQHSITFEKLLRSFPLLSKAVSERFYKLFHHNNYQFRVLRTNTRKKLVHIKVEFHSMLDEAYKIISDSVKIDNPDSEQTYNIINHILSIYPGLDLNKLVHEYVELNLYDKLWSQLIYQFNYLNDDKESYDAEAIKVLTAEKYNKLSCLALNQLEIPVDKPWIMNELHERVSRAIEEFSKLADSSIVNSSGKTKIITNTVNILTTSSVESTFVIDADTLIGLLIMVVIHSKVDNLEAHLYYVKHFNSTDYSNDGHFNYIMSNLDAVLFHLSSSMKQEPEYSDLMVHSQQNFEFWSAIQNGDLNGLTTILDILAKEFDDREIPGSHFLKSRNINGESCLMFAIKSKNFQIYNALVNEYPSWFTIDDILFDKNISSNQNLLMTALSEEALDIAEDLVSAIQSSATTEEQSAYYNAQDNSGRSVGHYLFHDHKLMHVIGDLIDWELKDLNSHTPLFSLCRCYDHPNYPTLIFEGFTCVYKKYGTGNVNFDKHIDKSGNTLLHIILKNIPESQLLSEKRNLIDVNQLSAKNMTPLTLYVKYNRLENLKELLTDDRLHFLYEDSKNCYNVFDYLGFSAMKAASPNETFKKIEQITFQFFMNSFFPNVPLTKLAALNAKYDANKRDWIIFFRSCEGFTTHKSLEALKQIMYFMKLENPCTYFPDKDIIWLNFGQGSTTPYFHKHRVNELINTLNGLLRSMIYQSNSNEFFERFLEDNNKIRDRSTLDIIQEAGARQERKRLSLGEVKLSSTQIHDIQFFLNFSLNDLRKYTSVLQKFSKLITIADLKLCDVGTVQSAALLKLMREDLNYTESDLKNIRKEHEQNKFAWNLLHSYIFWIEHTLDELLKSILKILEELKTWLDLYHDIRELNSELRKIEEKAPNANGNHTEPIGDGSNTLSRRSTFSIDPIPDLDLEDDSTNAFFNFSNIMESKRTRYKKLIFTKSEKVKQIMKLNVDLKWEHEVIASEISSFLKFRSDFLRFGIKMFTKDELRRLKNSKMEQEKLLRDMRNTRRSTRGRN
ncbi:UPF0507 protein [Scheffersomyces xylosifermentans]|uniref:UPF0507 protein n=1 Tax=Scheffersomyces xylosifermentans TaxID=1304137 RepID=UPI00315D946A